MTAEPDYGPPLRAVLRDMQAEMDEAAEQLRMHVSEHGCRPGHDGCPDGAFWSGQVHCAQVRHGLTRFLNEES